MQTTAASFAKGLLALEGELTPILVQMVKSANTNGKFFYITIHFKETNQIMIFFLSKGLLDNDSESASHQDEVKQKLKENVLQDKILTEEDFSRLAPTNNNSLISALKFINNPLEMCRKIHSYIKELTNLIRNKITESKYYEIKLYHHETWELMLR